MEEFRQIKKYKDYEVSNLGNVKSLKGGAERILKQSINNRGYYCVGLYNSNGISVKRVHQLVAIAFLSHTPSGNKIVVDHKDNDQLNNNAKNLQLITNRENTSKDRKGGTSKYVGVGFHKRDLKWFASINVNGKSNHLGYFRSELEAAISYDSALKRVEGFNFRKALG